MLIAILVVAGLVPFPHAAAQDVGAWLIGTWNGAHSGSSDDATVFHFKPDKGGIVRTMERKGTVYTVAGGTRIHVEAAGTITKATEAEAEAVGVYTFSHPPLSREQSSTINYTFARNGDVLPGSLLGANNFIVPITLSRRK